MNESQGENFILYFVENLINKMKFIKIHTNHRNYKYFIRFQDKNEMLLFFFLVHSLTTQILCS